MKAHWLKIFLFVLVAVQMSSVANSAIMTRKRVLMVAEGTKEVEAFYNLREGKLFNCIEKSVLRACDSDWVTCIDDGWVVQYVVGERCPIKHDGRLQLTFVIDAEGNIVSKFPEVDYLLNPQFCMEDYDCFCDEQGQCLNFIYGQLDENERVSCTNCQCASNQCGPRVEAKPEE